MSSSAYSDAGVNIDAQDEALDKIKGLVRSTNTSQVLSDVGNFGGLFRLPEGLEEPVLVASADGVGTKLMVARMAQDYSTVGADLVNHCVNDILVQGATPLFFMDYVGAGVLDPEQMVELVGGVVAGCRENACVLLGGETAEMPGFYDPGDYELVGFIVGVADRARIMDGSTIEAGDILLGLPSAGLHTNGYSLARNILFEKKGLELSSDLEGKTVQEELLSPHKTYYPALKGLLGNPALKGLAHITGGGLVDNVPRILPQDLEARIDPQSWETPTIFRQLEEWGSVSTEEMHRVFNMGIGMVVVGAAEAVGELEEHLRSVGQDSCRIGEIRKGDRGVVFEVS